VHHSFVVESRAPRQTTQKQRPVYHKISAQCTKTTAQCTSKPPPNVPQNHRPMYLKTTAPNTNRTNTRLARSAEDEPRTDRKRTANEP
jgi:hypothetical protein